MSEELKETKSPGSSNGETHKVEEEKTTEIKVTSANDWEHADLGDQSRKDKFLKLMGANKEEHKGKIVIGEHNTKHKGDDPDKLNKNLEEQFQHGLTRKLTSGYRSHKGLGFSQEEETATTKEVEAVDTEVGATPDTDVVKERRRVTDETADDRKVSEKRSADSISSEKTTPNTEANDAPGSKKKAFMNFVKASDN